MLQWDTTTDIRMAKIKKKKKMMTKPNASENVKKLDLSYVAGGNIK